MATDVNALLTLCKEQGWDTQLEGDCLAIVNDEGVEAFLRVGTHQILVETVLFPASAVTDRSALNERLLRSMYLFPLSSVALKTIAGEAYYVAFGALSVESRESVILEEVEVLFANVEEIVELCGDNLKEVA